MSEETKVEKPTMKRRVAVYDAMGDRNNIVPFDADPETAELFKEYGKVMKTNTGAGNHYWLVVDLRYDMTDVLDYMNGLNGEIVVDVSTE